MDICILTNDLHVNNYKLCDVVKKLEDIIKDINNDIIIKRIKDIIIIMDSLLNDNNKKIELIKKDIQDLNNNMINKIKN